VLARELLEAVRGDGAGEHPLVLREAGRIAVDGCRAGEDETTALRVARRLEDVERPLEVHVVGLLRVLDRVGDRHDGGLVKDDLAPAGEVFHLPAIADVGLHHLELLPQHRL